MNQTKIMAFGLIASLSLSACSVSKSSMISTKSSDVLHTGVVQRPMMADLDIAKERATAKVGGVAKMDIEKAKQEALGKIIEEKGADVVVEPKYKVESEGLTTYAVTAMGYPATYTNFRKMELSDTTFFRYGFSQRVETYKPDAQASPKKKKGALTFVGILVGVLALLGIVAAAAG